MSFSGNEYIKMSSVIQKHEWRKQEKRIYLPKAKPEIIDIPSYKFIRISGQGNPNSPQFAEVIGALYSVAYGIKMTAKKPDCALVGHYDYTVYPLEGVWDITDEAKKNFNGFINKNDLIYQLMLRQPDFVTTEFFNDILEIVRKKKPHPLHNEIHFETSREGRCMQMLHVGSYENEAATFELMESFAKEQRVSRKSKVHREIYLSDFRKTAPEKLKTVLRFQLHESGT